MGLIKGIQIEVKVANIPDMGSRDPMYVGIYGKNGGREYAFNLAPNLINSPNQDYRFVIGSGCCSKPTDIVLLPCGELKTDNLLLDDIEYVYLRKLSRLSRGVNDGGNLNHDDDKLELQKAVITLCDASGNMRRFRKNGPMYFAYECGLQNWLPETARPGCLIRMEITSVDYGGDNIGNDISYDITAELNGVVQTMNIPEHHFNHGTTEPIYNRHFLFFMPGCCDFRGQGKITAYITEHDRVSFPWHWRHDDIGHEDIEPNIVCGAPAQNFSIPVNVIERGNTAAFVIHGVITSTCQG